MQSTSSSVLLWCLAWPCLLSLWPFQREDTAPLASPRQPTPPPPRIRSRASPPGVDLEVWVEAGQPAVGPWEPPPVAATTPPQPKRRCLTGSPTSPWRGRLTTSEYDKTPWAEFALFFLWFCRVKHCKTHRLASFGAVESLNGCLVGDYQVSCLISHL